MPFDFKRALLEPGGKALPAHPAFMDFTTPVSVYSPGASRQDAKLSQREAGRHAQAYGGAEAIDWVYDCVNLYSDTTSTAEWHLERNGKELVRAKTPGTPPDLKVGPKDLFDLLDKPNPFMLYDELVALLVIDLLLVGNGYWFKWRTDDAGKPLALYRLAPGHVKIIPGPFGPKSYEYQPPGAKDPLKIAPESVMHFRLPNPHDAYYGMGVIRGGGRSMDLDIALTDTMAAYYENRADPSLIVQSDRRVPRDVFNKLRAQLRARVAGSSRAGELLVLEAGLKASTLTPTASNALYVEASQMSRDRIFAAFRASPKLFGIMDETGGSDKTSDARTEFDTHVIRPFMDKLQRRITEGLTQAWGVDFVIDHRSTIPVEEILKNAGLVAALPGIKMREIRRLLGPLGIDESTGDPKLDELVLNVPGEELDPNGQNGSPDQNLPGEAGRPPKIANTTAFGSVRPATKAGQQQVAGSKALMDDLMLRLQLVEDNARIQGKAFTDDHARTTVGNHLPDEQAPADTYLAARTADVDDTAAFIQAGLQDAMRVLERGLLDTVEGKAFKSSDIVRRLRNAKAWTIFTDMVTETLEAGAKRAISSSVMQQADAGRQPDDELDYDAIARSVVHRPEGLRAIVKTLKDRVVAHVKDRRATEPTQQAITSAVREVAAEWSTGQAETIALSEAVEAFNEGTLTVAELTGSTDVYVIEEEDAPDKPCQEARGQLWSIEHARQHRKEHPRCRRAFLALDPVG